MGVKLFSWSYRLFVSFLIIFSVYLLIIHELFLSYFIIIYIILGIFFIWFKTTLWAIVDVKSKIKRPVYDKPFTVIIPIRNESPKRFWWALDNIVRSKGQKQILVGDDNSSEENLNEYKKICRYHRLQGVDISLFSFKHIKKRRVQCKLHKLAKYDLIVNVDSDVVVQNDALLQVLSYFNDEKVGIANSRLRIFDGKTLLEKCYRVLYDTANQIGRKIFGAFGQMPCASGEILAYRKKILDENFERYSNAFYLWGIPISYGEDRLFTNIVLSSGYKSVYCEDSVGWTWGKKNLKDFLKQQTRWRRSWIRESVRCLSFCYKKPILMINTLLNLLLPLFFTLLVFAVIIRGFLSGLPFIIVGLIIVIIFTTYIRDLPLIFEDPPIWKYLFLFAIFNLLFLTPLWILALITIDSSDWGTR